MVINTPTGSGARSDGYEIRSAAVRRGIPCITTMTGASAAARAIVAARERRRRAALAAGAARAASGGAQAAGEVAERAGAGAVRPPALRGRRQRGDRRLPDRLGARRRAGPSRAPASSTCSPPTAGAARAAGRTCRAPSRSPRPSRPTAACGSTSCSRRSAPGPSGWPRSQPGDGAAPHRPARAAVLGPGRARARRRRARSSSAAGSGSRRWRSCAASSPQRGVPQRVLLGFRDRAHSGGLELFRLLGGADRLRGRPHRPPGLRHRPARGDARGRRRRRRRRLRLRPAGDARGGAGALRRARGARRAGDGDADGLRLRLLLRLRGAARAAAATCGSASTARSSAPTRSRRRWSPGSGIDATCRSTSAASRLAHPIINGSGTFDAIAARRAFGDALDARFPFSIFVSKTITPEPRAGNPPPRLYETPAGMINSIGLPNKGLEGFLERRPAAARARCRCRCCVSVMATEPRGLRRAWSSGSASRDEVAAIELNVSCPERQVRADRRRAAGRDARAAARRCAR